MTAVTAAVLAVIVSKPTPALFGTKGLAAAVPGEVIDVGFYFDGYAPDAFIGDVAIDPPVPVVLPPYFLPYELPYFYVEPAVFCPPLITYGYYGSGRLSYGIYGPYPPTRYSSIYAGFGRTWASFPHRPFRGYKASPTHIPARWTPVRQ